MKLTDEEKTKALPLDISKELSKELKLTLKDIKYLEPTTKTYKTTNNKWLQVNAILQASNILKNELDIENKFLLMGTDAEGINKAYAKKNELEDKLKELEADLVEKVGEDTFAGVEKLADKVLNFVLDTESYTTLTSLLKEKKESVLRGAYGVVVAVDKTKKK